LSGGFPHFGEGHVSAYGWRIDQYPSQLYTGTPLPRYDYNYFYSTLGLGAEAGDCPTGPASGIFKCGSGLPINNEWNLGAVDKMIVFVEGGDLNINAQINVPKGAFLAFIVNGTITVADSVGVAKDSTDTSLEGIYFAQQTFNTGSSGSNTERLNAKGIFAAQGGFTLGRDLGDENEDPPAETFEFDPRLVVKMPKAMRKAMMSWQEVAP